MATAAPAEPTPPQQQPSLVEESAAPQQQQLTAEKKPAWVTKPQVVVEDATKAVKVHPLAVFSILDHFTRRQDGQERVIGTLLGTRTEETVEITNCFAVPHTEKEGEVAVGQSTNKSMYALLSKINDKEKIVGWYATSNGANLLDESSSLIHDFYVHECENPVHLAVDSRLSSERGVEITAYSKKISSNTQKNNVDDTPGLPLADCVRPLAVEVTFSEPELFCVDAMLEADGFGSEAESVATFDEHGSLSESLANISDLIDTCLSYCLDIQHGRRKPNPETTRHVLSALDALPKLDPDDLDRAFHAHTQDIMMVSYLANITKTHLAIASKIHSTF